MIGNMLDRNLIFFMCDYISRRFVNFLNFIRVYNLVKILLNFYFWLFSILLLCGIVFFCIYDKVFWAVFYFFILVFWDVFFFLFRFFYIFDRLFGYIFVIFGRIFVFFWFLFWKRNIKVIVKIFLIFGYIIVKKLLYYVVDFF